MSETIVKRREWVKNAAIVFLAFLLILTLFSNTIRNRSLPEVAVQYTTSDSVSSGIRVSGTVNASDSYSITVEETRTVASVLVRNGDEVAAGDVLIELEDEESEELTAARKQLEALQLDYERALLSATASDTDAEAQAVKEAQAAYDRAVSDRKAYKSTLAATDEQKAVDNAKRTLESLKLWYGEKYDSKLPGVSADTAAAFYAGYIGVDIDALFVENFETITAVLDRSYANLKSEYPAKVEELLNATHTPDSTGTPVPVLTPEQSDALNAWIGGGELSDEMLNWLTGELSAAGSDDLFNAEEIRNPLPSGRTFAELKPEYAAYKEKARAAAEAELNNANWAKDTVLQNYDAAVSSAAQALENAKQVLADRQAANTAGDKLAQMDLQEKKDAIAEQQALVSELMADTIDAVIVAKQAGLVTDLIAVAGEKLMAGDTACVIQLTGTGYTADISVTAAQAARVRVGSEAAVSGYYWGETPRATVTGIRNDTAIRGNRIITLSLSGSVETGSTYNFILGETSAMYDVVIPKSALREDNTGTFVLIVTNKSSPLGTRYYATRLDVSVLASDDTRCAVSGDFSGWDYVITSSSAPIESGDMVRLANA